MTALNLALAFVLELAALAALAVWGVHADGVVLGVAAPLLAAVLWGALIAPNAAVTLSGRMRFALACVVFACASAGLIDARHTGLGIALAVAFLANRAALAALS